MREAGTAAMALRFWQSVHRLGNKPLEPKQSVKQIADDLFLPFGYTDDEVNAIIGMLYGN